MDLFNELVTEVLLSDVSTKGFAEFEKKYLPMAHRTDLFVQFTKFADNVDDKRFVGQAQGKAPKPNEPESKTQGIYGYVKRSPEEEAGRKRAMPDMTLWVRPSHSDPAAIYTYPLEFVVNHPTSIPYGANSYFLRVIKMRPGAKVLDLQQITKPMAFSILQKMGAMSTDPQQAEAEWENGVRSGTWKFKPYPVTIPKVFFLIAQSRTEEISKPDSSSMHLDPLSNNQQRTRFLKAGIQVVLDTARTKDAAVIHSNEPEQAFFMSRDAFDVVDVYKTGAQRNREDNSNPEMWHHDRAEKSVAAKILQAIDPKDQIVQLTKAMGGIDAISDPLQMSGVINFEYALIAISKRGRAISVSAKNVDSENNDFSHRRGSRFLDAKFNIGVHDVGGSFKTTMEKRDELQTTLQQIAKQSRDKPVDKEWKPVRGLSHAGSAWRDTLRSVPLIVRKENREYVDIDWVLKAAPEVAHQLGMLLKEVGWNWQKPEDPGDCLACWIAANQFYWDMLASATASYRNRIDKLKYLADKLVKGDRTAYVNATEAKTLKGTKVEKLAMSILAGSMSEEFRGDKTFLTSLIHGLEHIFLKRWIVMMDGAYQNFRTDISKMLPELIVNCDTLNYQRALKMKWKSVYNHKKTDNEDMTEVDNEFYAQTGEHARPEWRESINEVISGNNYSIDTVNSGPGAAATPTVWKNPSKEASFEAPRKKGAPNPVIARAKGQIEKIIKRHLTWVRDPSTGSETAYIGHGRKVRLGLHNVAAGPMVIPIRADRMPSNLGSLLGV